MSAGKGRAFAINATLALASTLLTYLVLELFFLRSCATWMPLKTHKGLYEGIRVVAQSSKRGTLPKDYVALVGDSYAAGKGDWFKQENRFRNPAFHSAHVIHERTGRDVVTFGANGAGSLRMIAEPIAQFAYLNATALFSLDPPDDIVVYFYEGNDLNDNLEDLRLRFAPEYDMARVYDPDYFRGFIDERVIRADPVYMAARSPGFADNLFLGRLAAGGVRVALDAVTGANAKPVYGPTWILPEDGGHVNRVLVAERETAIPDRLQSPPLELDAEGLRLGVYVFEQALRGLADAFPGAQISIAYLPSPLSSYRLNSERVSALSYDSEGVLYERRGVEERSDDVCARIEAVARRQGMGFVDTRPFVRAAAAEGIIHGPQDWYHFNRQGYTALGEAIVALLDGAAPPGCGGAARGKA